MRSYWLFDVNTKSELTSDPNNYFVVPACRIAWACWVLESLGTFGRVHGDLVRRVGCGLGARMDRGRGIARGAVPLLGVHVSGVCLSGCDTAWGGTEIELPTGQVMAIYTLQVQPLFSAWVCEEWHNFLSPRAGTFKPHDFAPYVCCRRPAWTESRVLCTATPASLSLLSIILKHRRHH